MNAAHVYFGVMAILMVALVFLHCTCIRLAAGHPCIMPQNEERWMYQCAEAAMALACLATIVYMWLVLPIMVAFCATSAMLGFWAHAPWIVTSVLLLLAKSRQTDQLLRRIAERCD